jgi:hypothetical protein
MMANRVASSDPGVEMNCPMCGARLTYLRTENRHSLLPRDTAPHRHAAA